MGADAERHPFLPKQELLFFYKGKQLQMRYIPDLIVVGQVVVEIKAVKSMLPDHEAQLFNYMRITRQPVGYLVNFAPLDKLEWKRFVLSEFVSPSEPILDSVEGS